MTVDKISYDEAKDWFWMRTWLWALPTVVISIVAHYVFSGEYIDVVSARIWISAAAGMAAVLLGILAALISMHFPWMRAGRRYGFLLTGPACAAIAALVAFVIGSVILSVIQGDPVNPPPYELVDSAYVMTQFGMGASALWGFIFGSWFALRRDRYFVELI